MTARGPWFRCPMSERVRCPVCGKIVGGYVPRGGDGTGLRPRSHRNRSTGQPCEGRFHVLDRSEASHSQSVPRP